MSQHQQLDGYRQDQDYLADLLQLITLQLEQAVTRFRSVRGDHNREGFLGLFMDDRDIDRTLSELKSGDQRPSTTDAIQRQRQQIILRTRATPNRLPPQRLAEALGLGQRELDLVLYLLAGEVDPRFARVWAFLQDDVQRRSLTPALVERLSDLPDQGRAGPGIRSILGSSAPLLSQRVIRLSDAHRPLLERTLHLDDRIADFLLGHKNLDARLDGITELVAYPQRRVSEPLPAALRNLQQRIDNDLPLPPVQLVGEARDHYGLWLARKRGMDLLRFIPPDPVPDPGQWQELLIALRREQRLRGALVSLAAADSLTAPQLAAFYGHLRDNVLVTSQLPVTTNSHPAPLAIMLPEASRDEREASWRKHLPDDWLGRQRQDLISQLAGRYRLNGEQIAGICGRFCQQLRLDPDPGSEQLQQLCKSTAAQPMQGGARRVECRQDWDQLVLPDASKTLLGELVLRASHQHKVLAEWHLDRLFSHPPGLSALFVGPSGTGKTMAASVIARSLGLELYRIDLATVVSKYIGETEKNLQTIFDHAARADVVLFFDEADALFGKRSEVKDAHDRYANIETSYLLQKIEEHTGVCILASNLAQNIDEAFMRRLQVVVEFPFPGFAEREQIWRQLLTTGAPTADDLDLPFLARQFELTGAHIRNILLLAGCYASGESQPITMRHLVRAIAREYIKIGKPLTKGLFGSYYQQMKQGPTDQKGAINDE
jgi:hypothetical protein